MAPNASAIRCSSPVTVYGGDTVYSIARRCGVSVRELIDTNGLEAPYALSAGMRLRMPGAGSVYIVQRGDSLSVIARTLHVDFHGLAAANGKAPPYTVYLGERLRIPEAGAAPGGRTVIASPSAGRTAAATVSPPPPEQNASLPLQPPLPPPGPPPASSGALIWPVKGEVITDFGPQAAKGQNNDGINIAAAKGTPIVAADSGTVAYIGNQAKGFGNLILIKHADGWMTAYAHADHVSVRRGEVVRRGQTIATVGATGSVTTPQLHFEVRHGTEVVNPLTRLPGEQSG